MNALKLTSLLILAFGTQKAGAQISGTAADAKEVISLTSHDGMKKEATPDAAGKYSIPIKDLKKGVYNLSGVGDLYLEPDYKLVVAKSENGIVFTGKGAVENQIIQQAKKPLQRFQSRSGYGLPMSAFLTEPDKFVPMVDEYKSSVDELVNTSKNKTFIDLVKKDAEYKRINTLYNYKLFYGMDSSKMDSLKKYLSIPLAQRTKDHSALTYKAYQMQFSKKLTEKEKNDLEAIMFTGWDINNEELFKSSAAYRDAISNRLNYALQTNKRLRDSLKNDNNMAKLVIAQQSIANPYIRDHFTYTYTLSAIKAAKTSESIKDLYQGYLAKNATSKYKEAIETAYNNVVSTQKNANAPDFSYANTNGELVTLKSMKGNFVYIDLWATWCGPCIAEIPALKKVESNYHGKNIKFVSISIDVARDKDKWLKFVSDNQLGGVQLMADNDWNSDFVKKFGVNSIPRFILIGPDGKVIDNNAKRPSNPLLQTELDKLMTQAK